MTPGELPRMAATSVSLYPAYNRAVARVGGAPVSDPQFGITGMTAKAVMSIEADRQVIDVLQINVQTTGSLCRTARSQPFFHPDQG
jgi:hypothetical protein